jgi:hypothetical protein
VSPLYSAKTEASLSKSFFISTFFTAFINLGSF